jgi:Lipid A 3-O-deacylase (PagL)
VTRPTSYVDVASISSRHGDPTPGTLSDMNRPPRLASVASTARSALSLTTLAIASALASGSIETDSADRALDTVPATISMTPRQPANEPAKRAASRFGAEGSEWLWAGWAIADDFESAVDQYAYFAWSTFLADDVELALEAGLWHFNQPGDNEGGLSGSLLFRWHFINKDEWTVYAQIGIGAMGATGDVPDDGTSFNLMPRAGVGVTKQLDEAGVRLDVGLRWHHISNARINGDDDNPSRDGAMLYVGLIFPF